MTIFSAAVLLFLVMDPFGNVPFFIASLETVDARRRQRVVIRELLIALVVMILFLFGGRYFLSALQITQSALTAAGGTLLLLIAIRMVFPRPGQTAQEDFTGEPFIVPLAVPYVAGPSALASLLLIMNREPARWPEWLLALVLAWSACGLILLACNPLSRLLGRRGLIALERLMGMVLVAIAVQMLMTGIAEYAKG